MEVKTERLVSLDILRGFTMIWIIGGEALIHSLANSTDWFIFETLSQQMTHAQWNGFHFFDLIFPLFMFVSGVAVPFSIGRSLNKGAKKSIILKKTFKRAAMLVLLGIIYNNKFSFDFVNLRYASVLGQIGIAYFIAVCVYLYTNTRGQIMWIVGILLGFWAVMTLIPVPGIGAGVLTPEGNFSGYIDRLLLPGVTYCKDYDPQGILLMISAATITLAGILAGKLMNNKSIADIKRVGLLISFGSGLIVIGLIWNIWYPINKEIWSSSYNVLTIGLSLILLSLFYFIIDIKGIQKWTFPFVLIGLNPITIYMANRMIDFKYTSEFIMNGIMNVAGDFAQVFLALGVIGLEISLLYFLYKRKIFLKV